MGDKAERSKQNEANPAERKKQHEANLERLTRLMNAEETPQNLELKARLTSEMAVFYHDQENLDEARQYFLLALEFAKKLPELNKIAALQGALASLLIQFGEFPAAQTYANDAYDYWKKTTQLDERIACLQNLGIIALNLSDEVQAVDHILKALNMAMQLDDEDLFAKTIQILLVHYESSKNYEMLFETKVKAFEFWHAKQLPEREFKTLIDLGVISQMMERLTDAEKYFKSAYNTGYNMGDSFRMLLAQQCIGETYFRQRDIPLAIKTYSEALKLVLHLQEETGENAFENEANKIRAVLLTLGVSHEELKKI